eukprot:Gb_17984 [translate_table: standard]
MKHLMNNHSILSLLFFYSSFLLVCISNLIWYQSLAKRILERDYGCLSKETLVRGGSSSIEGESVFEKGEERLHKFLGEKYSLSKAVCTT